jgi:hypothetical protein
LTGRDRVALARLVRKVFLDDGEALSLLACTDRLAAAAAARKLKECSTERESNHAT